MLKKFQRLAKKKKRLYKKPNIQKQYYDLKRKSILLKYKNLSIYSSIGIFINYITDYMKKNRRKFRDKQNYQLGILVESVKTVLFRIFKLSNSFTSTKSDFYFILLGYKALLFSFFLKLRKIQELKGISLVTGVLPKQSYKINFSRKKVKSIKKRIKKKLKFFF